MYRFEERTVEIEKLRPSPVKVTLQTERLFDDIVSTAKSHPERIEPITVAVLGSVQYIANGHLRVAALKRARVATARAQFVHVREISDVVRLHIELNHHGSINPLGMMDAVTFLRKHGGAKSISQRYAELAQKSLYPSVRAMVEKFLADACKKYTAVELPLHVVEWIVEFEDEKKQASATTVLLDSLRHAREARFAFPSPHDLDMISNALEPRGGEEREVRVYEPEPGKAWPKIQRKEAEDLVRGTPNDSIVVCRCGKRLLINSKTGRVSTVTDDKANRCMRIVEEDPARPVYAMPDQVVEFLGVERDGPVRFVKIGSKKELERFASSLKEGGGLRLVVVLPG